MSPGQLIMGEHAKEEVKILKGEMNEGLRGGGGGMATGTLRIEHLQGKQKMRTQVNC